MCPTWLVWPPVEPSFASAPELPGTCCLQAQVLRSRLSRPPWQGGHRGYGKVASCRPEYMRASFHSVSRGE